MHAGCIGRRIPQLVITGQLRAEASRRGLQALVRNAGSFRRRKIEVSERYVRRACYRVARTRIDLLESLDLPEGTRQRVVYAASKIRLRSARVLCAHALRHCA